MRINSFLKTLLTPQAALIAGLLFFVIAKLYLLFLHHDIRWDEAVYLNMGKYVFSQGAQGFWETLRPPLWPLLLGFFWLVGDAVLLGEITMALVGIAAPVIMYFALREYINEWLASGAALLLLFSSIWFWNSSMLMTGVLSAALIILSYYLHQKERYTLSGLVAAAAFLTRFPAGMGFAALMVTHLVLVWRNAATFSLRTLIPGIKTGLGFSIPVVMWLGINAYIFREQGLVRGALAPLIQGSGNVFFDNTWLHNTEPLFYFAHLALFLPITIFALFAFPQLKKHPQLIPYGFLAIFTLVFFTVLPNNQWRFALLIIPGLIVLATLGITQLAKRPKILGLLTALLFVNVLLLAVYDASIISHRGPEPSHIETEYYTFLIEYPVNGTILVSDPVVAWYAPNPVRMLYYEFLYNHQEYFAQEAAAVFFVPRNLPCHPEDRRCIIQRQIVTQHLVQHYALVHTAELHGYKYFIFSNQIDLPAQDTEQVFDELTYVLSNPQ